jgi:predicted nucleic acid-binding protein
VTVALAGIREASIPVNPTMPVHITLDPDDNIFLECADAAPAHYLITGNLRGISLKHGEGPGL